MKKIVLFSMICLGLTGCKKEAEIPSNMLRVSTVAIEGTEARNRGVLLGSTFGAGTQIGVALVKTVGGDVVIPNSRWISGPSWSTPEPVYLNSDDHTAYAYYPYRAAMTDPESVAVFYDQQDYMTGASSSTTLSSSSGHNAATFVLRRVMTRASVFVRKETTYKGAGKLTYVCLRNAPRSRALLTNPSDLRLNIKTGKISNTVLPAPGSSLKLYNEDNEIAYPVTLATTITTASTGDAIFAPVQSFNDGDIEIYLIVDGQEYIVPIPSPAGLNFTEANGGWKAGYSYRYTLTVTPNHIALSAITINDWIEITDPIIPVH